MYTLFRGLYKYLTSKEEYYAIILGLDNAGKTTLLEKIKSIFLGITGLSPDQIAPTVGCNLGKIAIQNSELIFWDLGGQKDLMSIWENYYAECHGIIFVIDGTDKERLQNVRDAFEKVINSQEVEGVPVLVLANKQDVEGAMRVEEIKELFNPIAVKLEARDTKVMPCSALNGEGVKEAVDWMYDRMCKNGDNRPPRFRNV